MRVLVLLPSRSPLSWTSLHCVCELTGRFHAGLTVAVYDRSWTAHRFVSAGPPWPFDAHPVWSNSYRASHSVGCELVPIGLHGSQTPSDRWSIRYSIAPVHSVGDVGLDVESVADGRFALDHLSRRHQRREHTDAILSVSRHRWPNRSPSHSLDHTPGTDGNRPVGTLHAKLIDALTYPGWLRHLPPRTVSPQQAHTVYSTQGSHPPRNGISSEACVYTRLSTSS